MDNFTLVNSTVIFCAKRRSGKSTLLKHIVESEMNKFDKIFLFCPTEEINNFYSDVVKTDCIFNNYNEEWIENLIKQMTNYYKNKKANEKDKKVLLILDDCVSDVKLQSSNTFKKIFTRGRHIGISLVITTQYLNLIPSVARTNADFVVVGQLNSQSIKLMCDEYKAGSISNKTFEKLYYSNTNDYKFLVINNNCVENNDDLNLIYGVLKFQI